LGASTIPTACSGPPPALAARIGHGAATIPTAGNNAPGAATTPTAGVAAHAAAGLDPRGRRVLAAASLALDTGRPVPLAKSSLLGGGVTLFVGAPSAVGATNATAGAALTTRPWPLATGRRTGDSTPFLPF
ncbi:unnamed protein product, partial [Ectocarpus sp. 13 AM-2016]